MIVRVKLFAVARQRAECDEVELTLLEGATVADVRRELAIQSPSLAEMVPHVAIAVDSQYAGDAQVIGSENEIACIPPVSGG